MLLGKYKAYYSLVTYLDEKKFRIHYSLNGNIDSSTSFQKIQ